MLVRFISGLCKRFLPTTTSNDPAFVDPETDLSPADNMVDDTLGEMAFGISFRDGNLDSFVWCNECIYGDIMLAEFLKDLKGTKFGQMVLNEILRLVAEDSEKYRPLISAVHIFNEAEIKEKKTKPQVSPLQAFNYEYGNEE